MSNLVLIDLIKNYRAGDTTTFEEIYESFKKLILFYAHRLKYDDSTQDLILFFIELLYSVDLSIFEPDESEGLKHYIAVAIRNHYIFLSKSYQKTLALRNCLYENCSFHIESVEERMCMIDALKCLSERQRTVIIYKYIYNYSDIEIAQKLNISRQAVNQLKLRSIEILKRFYTKT